MRRIAAIAILLVGLGLTSCSQDMSGPVYQRVSNWESGTGFTASVSTIDQDFNNVNKAYKKRNYPSAKTFCVVLGNDVQDANGNLPSPSSTVTLALSKGYTDLYNGAIKCYEDSNQSSELKLKSDVELMTAGVGKIELAVNEIKTIENNKINN